MHVREATPGDAAAVRRVADAAWHDAHDDVVGADAVEAFLAEHYDLADLRERYRSGESTTYVAEVDGRVVGYATGVPTEDGYELGAIYVHPDRQGDGVGTDLLEHVEAAGVEAGFDSLRLVVLADNEDAVAFYESRGFELVDERASDVFDAAERVYEKPIRA
jgi:ribosomal protein S18 acetylase RimI-like enzyme